MLFSKVYFLGLLSITADNIGMRDRLNSCFSKMFVRSLGATSGHFAVV